MPAEPEATKSRRPERATPFIIVDVNAPDHPKIRDLARRLGVSRNEAWGAISRLWCWLPENRAQGRLDRITAPHLAAIMELDVDHNLLEPALVDAGLVDQGDDGVLQVHDWRDPKHTGYYFWGKAKTGAHGNHVRWNKPDRDCFWCDRHVREHVAEGVHDYEKCGLCRLEIAFQDSSLRDGIAKNRDRLYGIADQYQD
jgi:hypothetical protein